jgi:hypothetical protein
MTPSFALNTTTNTFTKKTKKTTKSTTKVADNTTMSVPIGTSHTHAPTPDVTANTFKALKGIRKCCCNILLT